MAHVAKYTAAACGGMCAHYDRTPELERGYRRDNIDSERTRDNYNLAPNHEGGQVAFINERIASLDLKRAPRKDAVRMCDCVLTMPKTLDPERTREFFECSYEFLCGRYGAENVVSAYVHMDEAQPHMHFAWVPVTEDGRLSAKDVVTRRDLRTLHGDMQKSLEEDMGCKVDVLLDPEKQGEKQLSALSQSEYIAAKDEIAAAKTRLEHLQQLERELEPAAETLAESVRTLYKARGDGDREKGLAGEIEGLRSRISDAEGDIGRCGEQIAECRSRTREVRARNDFLEGRVEPLRGRVEAARAAFEQLREKFERVRGFAHNVGERAAVLLRSLGVQAFAGNPSPGFQRPRAVKAASQSVTFDRPKRSGGRVTLDDEIRRARSATDAYNSRHPMRGGEQGRDR